MYGFGGVPHYLKGVQTEEEQWKLVRCWNLLGEPAKDELGQTDGNEARVEGKIGALSIYHKAVLNTTFAGPTYFSGILRRFLSSV